ncbi:uncharacterized protein FOMMEDRAFT_146581 [Fomitiporia mediterranea MF3/22]|uniref:uncharacterized protein n=1 Tax=Fomitiporia mediterranea (strain MF3/22) TaxID=694068 RepID=UPI00044094EF|nr:uncharacterized protein FOMMEDRAFT_146581 [Fomitiporia mediterranea MF3/22]EJD02716.1 hypothetical protein FOMMEDRAFT_146581 [Fomitiporia mediterranea MF3/22]
MTVDLPEDIQFLVIEAYASQCTVKDALCLFTISRAVKSWVEPHVYSKVTIKTGVQAYQFTLAVRGERNFCRPAHHVKQLRIVCYTDGAGRDYLNWTALSVLELCPNLVHLAFDGETAFIESRQVSNLWPSLTRLSICSSFWINNDSRAKQLPIHWDRLKHLHIFGPIEAWLLHEKLLGRESRIDQFTSLESLCIDLRYSSRIIGQDLRPPQESQETLFRELFNRLSRLRRVVIKTYFTGPEFRDYWNDLAKNTKDESRIVFEISSRPFYDFCAHWMPDDPATEVDTVAVHRRLIQTLDRLNQLWDAEN